VKQIVVNADDLGMTRGVNRGIFQAHRSGLVTSTSLIANGAAFEDAVAGIRECPNLSVGLHVNLTAGRPLAAGSKSSLAGGDGRFHSLHALAARLTIGAVSNRDLEAEITAQTERVIAAGIALSHFDSHENIHLHPLAGQALAGVARRMNVRWIRFNHQRPLLPGLLREAGLIYWRDQMRHLLAMLGYRLAASRDSDAPPAARRIVGAPQLLGPSPHQLFGAMLAAMEDGVTEWVCHPGHADAELRAMLPAREAVRHEAELLLLIDPESRRLVEELGAELIGYSRLSA
jgi:chitin disaccharide deacetylase